MVKGSARSAGTSRWCRYAMIVFAGWCYAHDSAAHAGWTITPRASVALAAGPVSGIRELSGVTYLGPQAGGLERFAAIQDENRRIVVFDVAFAANGTIDAATAVSGLTITGGSDFEGIVYTGAARNTVFVSEENTPTIREFSLGGGPQLQAMTMPGVYLSTRDNRGLEALTRSPDGQAMWTANEEALEIDGPDSSPTQSNVVRLQSLTDDGEHLTTGAQFAYLVDPIHAGSGAANDRSGLPDLAVLPDGALVALERSAASALPAFRSRMYQVEFAGATDIGGPEYFEGLADADYTPVEKSLLWSGAVGTLTSGNLEGLGLGPRLANGNWTLLGVLDNGGSGSNLIVSFELSLTGCAIAGDYNCNSEVNQTDFEFWKSLYGTTGPAGDGNGDGVVDALDYAVWRNAFEGGTGEDGFAAPEPGTVWLASAMLLSALGGELNRKR